MSADSFTVHPEPPAEAVGAGAFTVGDWTVDPATGHITRGATRVQLEPKAAEVLVYLAQHPGQVVSRQELEAAVWAGRVVSYDAVTNAVIKLRKAFGDDARNPRIIETLSKRGYRLVAPVGAVAGPAPEGEAPRGEAARHGGRGRIRRWQAAGVAASLATLLAAAVLFYWLPGADAPAPLSAAPVRIVVLPFANLDGDPEQAYFSHGIAQDLITELARNPHLSVIASNSAFAYQGGESLTRLQEELGVQYVLRGSVRRNAGRIRINAQLIDADRGNHLWAERYDERLEDTFAVQDAIVERIATSLKVNLRAGETESLRERYAASMEAYDHFLQGSNAQGRRAYDDLAAAQESFERAIALDPQFARAYASLALVHLREFTDGWSDDPSAAVERARALAQQATELDRALPEVHFVNAFIALFDRDYPHAIEELEQAIALRPSYADAHAAMAWVLHFAGRPDEGGKHLDTAVRLNPHVTATYLLVAGGISFSLGQTEGALASLERAVEISPSNPRSYVWLAAAQARLGRLDEASWTVEQLRMLHPTISLSRLDNVFPFKHATSLEDLKAWLREAGLPE